MNLLPFSRAGGRTGAAERARSLRLRMTPHAWFLRGGAECRFDSGRSSSSPALVTRACFLFSVSLPHRRSPREGGIGASVAAKISKFSQKAYGYILLCLISNALRKGEEKAVFFLSFWGALSIESIMVVFLKLSWKGEWGKPFL